MLTKTYTVAANSRFTIWVDDETFAGQGRALANVAVSTTLRPPTPYRLSSSERCGGPAEPSAFWYEAHNSAGATATGTRWALAEGEVGGARGYETYILLANTSATAGT